MMCQMQVRKRSLQISSNKLVNCVNNKSRTTNSEKLSVLLLNEKLRAKILYLYITESLILAQNERWRRGLGMQVERDFTL